MHVRLHGCNILFHNIRHSTGLHSGILQEYLHLTVFMISSTEAGIKTNYNLPDFYSHKIFSWIFCYHQIVVLTIHILLSFIMKMHIFLHFFEINILSSKHYHNGKSFSVT
jgi:hypothetical protein